MGDHAAAGDGGLDQGVQLLVSADRQLQVPWRDSLDLQVLGRIASELEHLGRQVLEDSCAVDRGGGADSAVGIDSALQESVDSSDWELHGRILACHGGMVSPLGCVTEGPSDDLASNEIFINRPTPSVSVTILGASRHVPGTLAGANGAWLRPN